MLIYAAKRIHYGDDTYNMCMELVILDWVRIVSTDVPTYQASKPIGRDQGAYFKDI